MSELTEEGLIRKNTIKNRKKMMKINSDFSGHVFF